MTPCAVCGRRGWDEWAVSDEEWKRYVPLEYQDKEICRVCYERFKRVRGVKHYTGVQTPASPLSQSRTLELRERFGPELRNMITEAEGQNREVGAMLCQTPAEDLHLSRACWGRHSRAKLV